MEWNPLKQTLQCKCTNTKEELVLGNSFYVPANTISFSNVFLKFSPHDQTAVLCVIAVILIVYIILFMWAWYQDGKDTVKVKQNIKS